MNVLQDFDCGAAIVPGIHAMQSGSILMEECVYECMYV